MLVISFEEESTETKESFVSIMLPTDRLWIIGELWASEDWFEDNFWGWIVVVCWFTWCSGVTVGSDDPKVCPFSFLEEDPDEHIGAAEAPLPLFAEFPEILAEVEFLLK